MFSRGTVSQLSHAEDAEVEKYALARDVSGWAEKERQLIQSCHPRQRDLLLDDSKRICALVSRGGGKTTCLKGRFARRMMHTPKARCLYIATRRDQAEELLWFPLKDLAEKLGIEAKWNEQRLRCTFLRNRSTLRLVGCDDKTEVEKLRGQPFHEVWIDEAGSFMRVLIDRLMFDIIEPRLGDYGGTLGMVGTPGYQLDIKHPFYAATMAGSAMSRPYMQREAEEFVGWKGWSFHTWTLQDGAPYVPALARLWEAALETKERNGWSDQHPRWRREYLAQWANDDTENVYKFRPYTEAGDEWNIWQPERDPFGLAKLPSHRSDWEYVVGVDFGHSDPTAIEVFAFSPTDPSKTLYHVYEYAQRGMYPRTIAELLIGEELNADRPKGLFGRIGWPSAIVAGVESLGGGWLDELANVYGIKIAPAQKKEKHDSIELANGDFIDGRIKVMVGSKLYDQVLENQWAIDDFGKLKENKNQRNDCADAFIYARREVARFLLAEEAAPPSPRFPPRLDPILEEPEDSGDGEFGKFNESFDLDDWGN